MQKIHRFLSILEGREFQAQAEAKRKRRKSN
jgi:hypothetical protein